jgi:hypothetical protein
VTGVKNGEFDDLYPGGSAALPSWRHCVTVPAVPVRWPAGTTDGGMWLGGWLI